MNQPIQWNQYPGLDNTTNVTLLPNHKYFYSFITNNNDGSIEARWRQSAEGYVGGGWHNNHIYTENRIAHNPFNQFWVPDPAPNKYVYYGVFDLLPMYANNKSRLSTLTVEQFLSDYIDWFGVTLSNENFTASGKIYNTTIINLKTIKFNLWDEQWISEKWYGNDGNLVSSQYYLSSKNKIHIIGGQTYYHKWPKNGYYFFYDKNGIFISRKASSTPNTTVTVPQNASFMHFSLYYGGIPSPVYNNDICINLSNSDVNGTYEAYEDRTYSIPITSITGKLNGTGNSVVVFPEGMKSAADAYDEIKIEDGITKAIKRIATIDLGTRTYSYGGWTFNTSIPNAKFTNGGIVGTTTLIYDNGGYVSLGSEDANRMGDYLYQTRNPTQLSITDPTYTSAESFKSSLNGVLLNYELASPEIYILDNFSLPINIKIWKYGMEELLPNNSPNIVSTSAKITMHYNNI